MVQRPTTARFMPSAWVFPGGAVDPEDATAPTSFRGADDWVVAALREMIEETGIWLTTEGVFEYPLTEDAFSEVDRRGLVLDPTRLVYFSNWITPEAFPIRFDTRFYLAEARSTTGGAVDGDELIDLEWTTPIDALHREAAGTWDVAFPTRKTLELLATESSASDLMAAVRGLEAVPPIQPRLFVGDDEARIVMPSEDLFDEIGPDQFDSELLERLATVVAAGGRVPAEFKRR
jgi:8-oxo-dGTP pyrophosphatase MutT (NUDIX family)